MNRRICVLFLILAPICWSLTGMLVKYIPWSPWAVAGYRSVFSAFFLWVTLKSIYPKEFRFDLSLSNLAIALFYSAFTTLFAVSSKLTTSANAVLLQYSAPIYIALISPFLLGEKSSGKDFILITLTLVGLCLFLLNSSPDGQVRNNEYLGLLAGAAAGFFWAMSIMLMKRKGATELPLSCLVLGNFLTVLYCLPAMLAVDLATGFGHNLFWAAILGIGPLGLGYVFYLATFKKVTAMEAGLIPSIEPLLNPIWTFLVIGEIPGFWTFLGGGLVLLAVGLKALISLRTPLPAMS